MAGRRIRDPTRRPKPQLSFACPFYLHNKDENQHCLNYELRRIVDVRQHIYRLHVQPSRCPQCAIIFQDDFAYARRDAHIVYCNGSNELGPPPGATQNQLREMSRQATKQRGPDQAWYIIWDIMFPGATHPPSPYVDVGHEQRSIEIGAAIESFRQSGGTQRFLGQLGVKEDVPVLDRFLNYFYNECSTATNEQQITTSNQPLPSRSQSPSTSVPQPTTQPKPERPTESQSQQGPSGTSYILQHLAKLPAGEPPRTVTNIESDIESVVSAVFSEASLDSSRSSTYTNVHVLAILDLANLLLHDDTMVTLYPQAMARLGSSRFQRNFTRLLKQYSKNLKQEATDELHFEAARFIRQYARRVANELTNMIQPRGYDDDRLQGGIDAISKEKELNRWIESRNWLQSASENFENDDEEDNLSDSSDSTAASESGNSSIGSLQGIRVFLVSSEAHLILRRDFGKWLNIEVEKKNGDDESSVADIPDTDYDVFVSLQIAARITNTIKRTIERLAGCKLSWWPLSQPGSDPNTGYTRVYSKSSKGIRFYDDISTHLAIRLFPKLTTVHSSNTYSWMKGWGREVVQLHETTLATIYIKRFGSNFVPAAMPHSSPAPLAQSNSQNTASGSNFPGQTTSQSTSSVHNNQSNTKTRIIQPGQNATAKPNPLLFLSADIASNASRARCVDVGKDDLETLHNLRAAYYSFASVWRTWKQPIGIRFYRFDSFLFKNSLNLYYISVHRDQERYPQAADPEYIEYRFQPQPWPMGALYPSNEVWYYFQNPDDCGTSTDLNQILPVRIQGRIGSRARAFGIHIEEAYSVWAILVPSFVVVSVTLAATAWFIPLWLSTHPGDLQNATVPITVVFTVVGSLLQIIISLVIFRWTPK